MLIDLCPLTSATALSETPALLLRVMKVLLNVCDESVSRNAGVGFVPALSLRSAVAFPLRLRIAVAGGLPVAAYVPEEVFV